MGFSSFDLLDAHVVGGSADHDALRSGPTTWTYARLLEEVSAFGGVLRHCGVGRGDRVAVALPDGPEAVVAVLAAARIGASPHRSDAPAGELVLVTASSETAALRTAEAAVVLVKQRAGEPWELREGRDYDWDVVMRAGRTDPAPLAEGAELDTGDPAVRSWAEVLRTGGTVVLPE